MQLTSGFKSSFEPMQFYKSDSGHIIVDESRANPVGAKARFGELLVQTIKKTHNAIGYVQPRNGFAGISLAYLCKMYDLPLYLAMPSSKEVSNHQALCIEQNCSPMFARVAAMPNLNRMMRAWCEDNDVFFVPLGLDHKLVTACAVRVIYENFAGLAPSTIWCAISTGVLSRALQIALPDWEVKSVAVSRNIQKGELGRSEFFSYHKNFTQPSGFQPFDFNTEKCYDAKAYHYMHIYGKPGDYMFNVAGNAPKSILNTKAIDSRRDWYENEDFNKNHAEIRLRAVLNKPSYYNI